MAPHCLLCSDALSHAVATHHSNTSSVIRSQPWLDHLWVGEKWKPQAPAQTCWFKVCIITCDSRRWLPGTFMFEKSCLAKSSHQSLPKPFSSDCAPSHTQMWWLRPRQAAMLWPGQDHTVAAWPQIYWFWEQNTSCLTTWATSTVYFSNRHWGHSLCHFFCIFFCTKHFPRD